MLLLKFDLGDIEKCKSVLDVFRMFGIAMNEGDPQDLKLNNKEVFGERAYYANMFISDETYKRIYEHLDTIGGHRNNRHGEKFPSDEAMRWVNYSPVSNGPRYDAVAKIAGEINDSVLYIVTPEDELYEEDPIVARRKENNE